MRRIARIALDADDGVPLREHPQLELRVQRAIAMDPLPFGITSTSVFVADAVVFHPVASPWLLVMDRERFLRS